MKRSPTKKKTERRKRPRSKNATSRSAAVHANQEKDSCHQCAKGLGKNAKALFVEEEVGRTFCSEGCIAGFFTPEIERLEKEYFKRLSPNDLPGEERESLAHLRWVTLQEPDEAWREKTLSGDHRYTLISEFQPGNKRVWCVCICLCLRGEPSFLYLAFITRNAAMVNMYRKGERIQWEKSTHLADPQNKGTELEVTDLGQMDRLASDWTEEETIRAKLTQERQPDDIPFEEFSLYQTCFEETLESPDEIWTVQTNDKNGFKLYHFLRFYPEGQAGVWYVIIARETEDDDQIEILDAFPTRDPELADRYRRGNQEIGNASTKTSSRVIH